MKSRLRKLKKKIRLHREGTHILVLAAVAMVLLWGVVIFFTDVLLAPTVGRTVAVTVVVALTLVVYCVMLNFFRCPPRVFPEDTEGVVVAPADGKVVVVENVEEREYFREPRLMISIFMNIFNVHANWVPVEGTVKLVRHHPGNYHVAWLPKASIENEHSTIVITTPGGEEVLVRQVAGAVARRVSTYVQEGEAYELDEHLGFIKFGSRVDVFLPLTARVNVSLGQRTTGNATVIAYLPPSPAR